MLYLLPQIIERTAEKFPTKEAFRFRDQALTYRQLEERMNALANTLIEQGVQRGDRVGIYMHKSLECAIAIYGIMRAGAAYVPLDPAAPTERIAFILRDCAISRLITGQSVGSKLKQLTAYDTPLICTIGLDNADALPWKALSWDDVNSASVAAPSGAESSASMEQDLAYIIYTSGSTGEPKGIMHTHHSGLSYARMAATLYGLTHEDRLSNFPPLHFDQSTFDYFSGALVGATTIIIPDEVRMLPASLSQLIEDEQISIWYSVPFALIQLLLRGALEEHDLSSLRWIIYGGEPFPPKYLKALQAQWPQAIFSNCYGPAEVNQVSYYHIPQLVDRRSGDGASGAESDEPIPIGQICANMDALVVDGEGQPVAQGEVGELLMRTPTMMTGYWNRPDLNERAFYMQNADGDQQLRYYRTGDLVRVADDGNYEFLGRKDRQIKTRGYRVELDEVEIALLSHTSVEEAAIYPLPDEEIGNLIRGAVILRVGEELKISALMKHLMTRIPPYALPAQIDLVDQFPRTTSGKIDRRALQREAMQMDDRR